MKKWCMSWWFKKTLPFLVSTLIGSHNAFGVVDQDVYPIKIFVSIPALKFFVEAIAGPQAEVHALVSPGQNEETYEPTIEQMTALSSTRIYFSSGLPFERNLLTKIQRLVPKLVVVDLHGRGRSETLGDDGHFWTSVRRMQVVIRTVETVLAAARPSARGVFAKNTAQVAKNLTELDVYLRKKLESLPSKEFFVYHPAWSNFASDYGLKQVAIEEHGREPGIRSMQGVLAAAKQAQIKTIFIQRQSNQKSIALVAQSLGVPLTHVDPLGEDYFSNLKHFADELAK